MVKTYSKLLNKILNKIKAIVLMNNNKNNKKLIIPLKLKNIIKLKIQNQKFINKMSGKIKRSHLKIKLII